MSASWFYAVGDDQLGPISAEDLRGKLICGELPVDTLVWSEGMAGWASAEKVPELFRPAPPKPDPTPIIVPQVEPSTAGNGQGSGREQGRSDGQQAGSMPGTGPMGGNLRGGPTQAAPEHMTRTRHAWHRFFARTADLLLFSNLTTLVMAGGAAATPETPPGFFELAISIAFSMAMWAFLEALFIMRWGMTPGKWIFRIRVVHEDNRFLTYSEALQRSFLVLMQGQFFGIPPMNLLFQALAFKELVDRDNTQWDRKVHTKVQHAPMRGVHIGVAVFLLVMVLMAAAQMARGEV
ncbi:MAG: RDD family protein [Planctomycetota bacterium]